MIKKENIKVGDTIYFARILYPWNATYNEKIVSEHVITNINNGIVIIKPGITFIFINKSSFVLGSQVSDNMMFATKEEALAAVAILDILE